ncbi:2-phytyl-1 4-beta-naphthoquinone methyltransferase chloroplastic, partial [Bienertia sinuspersici]
CDLRGGDWFRFFQRSIVNFFIAAAKKIVSLLQEHRFYAITMGYWLTNVIDKERSTQEIFRVLKPGLYNKSKQPVTGFIQDWMIDNVVVPAATGYGLAEEFSHAKFYEIAGGLMGKLVATR